MEYAIVDIETTGGNAAGSRITEIAIRIHNGKEIVDSWETLINPARIIPEPIFALTGINNEMVADAPYFEDVAGCIFEMLNGKIFVAHNVNFDYSFIKHELERAGFAWNAKKICTVRLARKLLPGHVSYSLGNLCNALAINIENRHRAGGDVDATVILFEKLLKNDHEDAIPQMIKKLSTDARLPPHLNPEEFEKLPSQSGVYYFINQSGKVVYVGKATNIKKRVTQHFTGHNVNPQRQHFLREIHHIDFEICATELLSLLKECIEIKKLWPPFNRALKRFEPKYGLFLYEGMDGFQYLSIGKIPKNFNSIKVFNKEYEAQKYLRELIIDFQLDARLCRFSNQTIGDDSKPLPPQEEHNNKISEILQFIERDKQSFYIVDKGRNQDELSYIWVENGQLYGMGYVDKNTQLQSVEDIKHALNRCYGNYYMHQLIETYAQKYPSKVHVIQDEKSYY